MGPANARPRTGTPPGAGSGEESWDTMGGLLILDAFCTKPLVRSTCLLTALEPLSTRSVLRGALRHRRLGTDLTPTSAPTQWYDLTRLARVPSLPPELAKHRELSDCFALPSISAVRPSGSFPPGMTVMVDMNRLDAAMSPVRSTLRPISPHDFQTYSDLHAGSEHAKYSPTVAVKRRGRTSVCT